MLIPQQEAKDAIDRWAICNIMDLPKNFLGNCIDDVIVPSGDGNLGVLNKVSSLYLMGHHTQKIRDSKNVKGKDLGNIRFKLSFGLNNVGPEFIKVMPILRVFYENDPLLDFSFLESSSGFGGDKPKYIKGDIAVGTGAYQVPQSYLELVSSTWRDLKLSKIEDVFTARVLNGLSIRPDLSRLLGYVISRNTNSNIYHMLVKYLFGEDTDFELLFIGFHFGIDLNKMERSDLFGYVTVIELRLKPKADHGFSAEELLTQPPYHHLIFDPSAEVNILSTQMNPKLEEEEETVQVLYQYLHPCPSTCNF